MTAFWVNLPKDGKWVGGPVTSTKYTGPLKIKWTLKNDGLGLFRYEVVTVADGVNYSRAEQGRNPGFKGRNLSGWFFVYDSRELVTEIELPAAGGVSYRVDATLGDSRASSEVFETRRILYYQPMTMEGVDDLDMADVEDHFWGTAAGYYVKLVREHEGETLTYRGWLDNWDLDAFGAEVKEHYQLADRSPLGFAIAWVRYLATKEDKEVRVDKRKVTGSKLHGWSQATGRLTITTSGFLWHGLDDADDLKKEWFVGLSVTLFGAEGEKSYTLTRAELDRVEIGDDAQFEHGGHRVVHVDLHDHGVGEVSHMAFALDFKSVGGWTAGTTKTKKRYIVMARRGRWEDRTTAELVKTMLHEIGHIIGMVPDGTGRLPDRPAHYYDYNGHNGPHCGKGATYSSAGRYEPFRWSGTPGCVMFGAGTIDEEVRPTAFCSECKPALRKLDLSTLGVEE